MFRSRVAGVLLALLAAGGCGEAKIGLPAGFPPDVPLPERAVLRTARDLGKKGLNVVFESGEGVGPQKSRGNSVRARSIASASESLRAFAGRSRGQNSSPDRVTSTGPACATAAQHSTAAKSPASARDASRLTRCPPTRCRVARPRRCPPASRPRSC